MFVMIKGAKMRLDIIAMALSGLCLLHCLVTPLILMSLPIMGRYYVTHPMVHILLAAIILPVTYYSFRKLIKGTDLRSRFILVSALVGSLIISLVPIFVHVLRWNLPEVLLLILGSSLLMLAHLLKINFLSARV